MRHSLPDILGGLKRAGTVTALRLFAVSVLHFRSLRQLYTAASHSRLGQFRKNRPELFGMVVTPFVCASWDASKRFETVISHCNIVENIGWPLNVGDHEARHVADLSAIAPGLHAELFAPRWLAREGLLSLALFEGKALIFGLSFTLGYESDQLIALIGGLQGAGTPDALSTQRRLTRLAHGMRPRDLLIEIFRMLCRHFAVERIYAVSNEAHVQRSAYSMTRTQDPVLMSYDSVWLDRGGSPATDGFFVIPVTMPRRSDDRIRPNKRPEYRRRYAMLDLVQTELDRSLERGAAGDN